MKSFKLLILILFVSFSGLTQTGSKKEITKYFQKEISDYIKAYNKKEWEKVTDKIYPKFFDLMPKDKMLSSLKDSEESGLKLELGIPEILEISDLFTHENEKFYLVKYHGDITVILSGKMLEEKDELLKNVKKSNYVENIKFNEKTNTLKFNAKKSMIAASVLSPTDWKFIELNENKSFIKKLLPKKVVNHFFPEERIDEYITEYKEEYAEDLIIEKPKMEAIFDICEEMPKFKEGESKLFKILQSKITYPKEAIKKDKSGHVYIHFVVEKDGSISKVDFMNIPIGFGCEKEAIRVVKSMPNWIPGKQRGKPVRVNCYMLVDYILEENTKKPKIEFRKIPPPPTEMDDAIEIVEEPKVEEIFTVVEKMPEFPGGLEALFTFINSNINYPHSAKIKNIQGTVFVQFVVEKNGAISNPKVIRSLDDDCDKEALRVVRLMPNWTPGTQRGKAVMVRYTLPIKFLLQNEIEIIEDEEEIMDDFVEVPEEVEVPKVEQIFMVVEKNCMFPGGEEKFYEYLGTNIVYPEQAKQDSIHGTVYASFVVKENGSISDVKILRGIGYGCDKEAIRILQKMPNWIPAEQRGKKVSQRMTIPVRFVLR